MLSELCKELNNWFPAGIYFGEYTIQGGKIQGLDDEIQEGQYFRIAGSVFNDGVYKWETNVTPTQAHPQTFNPVLHDEVFDGAVWAMAVPPAVIALAEEIDAWQQKYGGVDSQAMSPFQSESFGGYSYSKGSGSRGSGGSGGATWQSAFADRLRKWRKIRP